MAFPNKFTKKAQDALNKALHCAKEFGHTYIGTEHILLGLLSDKESVSFKILEANSISYENVKNAIFDISGIGIKSNVSVADLTPRARQTIEKSNMCARRYDQKLIGTEHLLLSLIEFNESVGVKIIESLSVQVDKIKLDTESYIDSVSDRIESQNADNEMKIAKRKGNQCSIPGCPAISTYGTCLITKAKKGKIDPVVGREKEISRVIQILARRTKNNPCLIGEPGVGKTAIIEGLAQKIADMEVPEMLKNKYIITLDIPSMIAGAKYRGEFEDRLKNVMAECSRNKDIILFVDEFHTIIGAGSAEGALDAANIIKPALSRGEMQIIGATTIDEYRKHIEKDAALERRFQPLIIEEPSKEDALKILYGLREKYEKHHGIKISDKALRYAIELSCRYINDRFLPDKAIDLIDEASSKLCIEMSTVPPKVKDLESKLQKLKDEKQQAILSQNFERAVKIRDDEIKAKQKYDSAKNSWIKGKDGSKAEITEEDIANVVTEWTKIPVNKLMESENEKLLSLEDRLSELVIGQKEAIKSVSNAIRRGRVKISDPDKPIGSYIFVGPTGVGKTELCKALALTLFGSKDAFIRFDMSEYMEKHSVSKLIGSPPGYIGYSEGGQLTDLVRRRPYCVLLFDEIEKAESEIFNIFLQILDDGILTDAQGRKVNFKNTLIIMTSNAGSAFESQINKIGFSSMSTKESEYIRNTERTESEIKKIFRPEFLNRIDEIIYFNPLSFEDIKKITKMLLNEFLSRTKNKDMDITIDDSAISLVAKIGFDKSNGARPIKRTITKLIEDEYAMALLKGEIKAGDKILIQSNNDKIIFEKIN